MGRVYHPWYKDRKTGERVDNPNWYAEWQGADGETHRKKVGLKKAEANEFLAMVEGRENRIRLGLPPDPGSSPDLCKPLTDLLVDYVEVLASKDTSEDYRDNVEDYLQRMFAGCEWHTWSDITSDSLTRFLGRRRAGEGVKCGNRPGRGNGHATLNNYIRTAKGFCNWLGKRIKLDSPLDDIDTYPEEVDRRRSKRILTDAELTALIEAALKGKRRGRQILTGRDRAMLYRVAAFTGLRAGELAELTTAAFDLEAKPPRITVLARDAKGKREEPIPIPTHLVDHLRPWLASKTKGKRVWPGGWARNRGQGVWLATDLARAGVAEFDEQGRRVTFHSLKRRYVVRLIQAGAKIHEVRRLARHRDIATTLNYYTDTDMVDLGQLAEKLVSAG